MNPKQITAKVYDFARAHSPEILTGVGVVLMVGAVFTAPKAAKKAEAVRDQYLNDRDKKKFIRGYLKAWGIVGGMVVGGTTCIAGGIGILHSRYVLRGTRLAAEIMAFKQYRKNVIADQGLEADIRYRHGLKEVTELKDSENGVEQEVVKKLVPNEQQPIDNPDDYRFVFDERNNWYTGNRNLDIIQMKKVFDQVNNRYQASLDGKLTMKEVLIDTGFEYVLTDKRLAKIAGRVGWDRNSKTGDGYISFGPMFDMVIDNPRSYILGSIGELIIELNCDGDIYGC